MLLFSSNSASAQCSKKCTTDTCKTEKKSCCSTKKESLNTKIIEIELLYLDLSVCGRCKSTDRIVEESIEDVKTSLSEMGYTINFTKTHIQGVQCAKDHAFVSSPTIRITNRDIVLETKESNCNSCGSLCGTKVDCRDWIWQGKSYSSPPKAMIIDAIFKSIYVKNFGKEVDLKNYKVPKNIKTFFREKAK